MGVAPRKGHCDAPRVMIKDNPKRQPQRPQDDTFRQPAVSREIVIPVDLDSYLNAIEDNAAFRALVDKCYSDHPECFPPEFENGFGFKDFRVSAKMKIRIRRIRVGHGADECFYRVVPSDIMPYMTGRVEDVEKPLFLRKFSVPFWALEWVFGRSACYYWRLERRMGMASIAGSLTGHVELEQHENTETGEMEVAVCECSLPEDLACDEKHAKYLGEKAYVAVSAGGGCVLGAELTEGADKASLVGGYGVLKEEIEAAAPGHKIKSVNTDGYSSTIAAIPEVWGKGIVLITCILHLYIAIRDGCKKKYREQFEEVADDLWNCYDAPTKRSFAQRWKAFIAKCQSKAETLPERIIGKLSGANDNKLASYKAWYDRPEGHRTSSAVDRVMGSLDRRLFAMRHLRGHFVNSRLILRAWAHLHNFAPWNPHTAKQKQASCPAEYLTKKRYRDNWLENFRVASSSAGCQPLITPKTS